MNNLMSTLDFRKITFVSGAGPFLIAADGGMYLDFFCDVGTSSLGYFSLEQRAVLDKLACGRTPFHAPNLFPFELRSRVAARLCAATDMDRVFFCNSGTEAVEAAIKMSRLWHHKNSGILQEHGPICTVSKSFHGRTYGALAAGDGPSYHTEGFGPLPAGFLHFDDLLEIPNTAAAVIVSPVFGNNDVIEYERSWLLELRRFCDKSGAILVFDEVQTGAGRAGAACGITYGQRIGITPDAVCLAKGIGMGAPVAALLAREPYGSAFTPGTHFSTFGGNPLGMACVEEMLDWLKANPSAPDVVGDELRRGLNELGWPMNVRGPGALIAFDSDVDTLALARAAQEQRLLIGAFRQGPGPVKLTPPLNISTSVIKEGLARLDKAYKSLRAAESV